MRVSCVTEAYCITDFASVFLCRPELECVSVSTDIGTPDRIRKICLQNGVLQFVNDPFVCTLVSTRNGFSFSRETGFNIVKSWLAIERAFQDVEFIERRLLDRISQMFFTRI
jgi:hypothetical protein